jgi:hypothetical protein
VGVVHQDERPAHVLSIRDPQPEGGVLQITPVDRPHESCDVGWVEGDISVASLFEGTIIRIFEWREDAGTRVGHLQHVDTRCQRAGPSLADVVDWLSVGDGSWLARTAEQELWRVTPEDDESQLVAGDVTALIEGVDFFSLATVFTVEGGQVVERRVTGEELQRFGQDATELHFSDGTVLFTTPEGIFGGEVSLDPEVEPVEPVLMDPGGCRPGHLAYGYLFSLSPCETRTLVARHVSTGEQRVFGSDVTHLVSASAWRGELGALFATGPDLAQHTGPLMGGLDGRIRPPLGSLWVAPSTEEPGRIADQVSRVRLRLDPFLEELSWFLLHDADEVQGTLSLWSPSRGRQEVAHGVAWWNDVGHWLEDGWVVHQYDGGLGELAFVDLDAMSPESMAPGVLPGSVRLLGFGMQASLGYLRDADPTAGTGTLEIRPQEPDGVPERIREGVREFLRAEGPRPGLVLAVVEEDGTEQVLFQGGRF